MEMNNIKIIYASSLHWRRRLALSNMFYLATCSNNISRKKINHEGPYKAIHAQPPVKFPLLCTVQVQFTVPRCPSPRGRCITLFLVCICVLCWSIFKFVCIEENPKIRITSEKGHENLRTRKNWIHNFLGA